jgi:hypothetical protein
VNNAASTTCLEDGRGRPAVLGVDGSGRQPSLQRRYRSDFTTLSSMMLQEQPAVVFLLKRALVSWSLGMDKHEDLCGSRHRSVIPYVHGRMELYCSSLTLPV